VVELLLQRSTVFRPFMRKKLLARPGVACGFIPNIPPSSCRNSESSSSGRDKGIGLHLSSLEHPKSSEMSVRTGELALMTANIASLRPWSLRDGRCCAL
jgi:hypothetical protein